MAVAGMYGEAKILLPVSQQGATAMAELESFRLTVCFALRSRLLIFFVTASPSKARQLLQWANVPY